MGPKSYVLVRLRSIRAILAIESMKVGMYHFTRVPSPKAEATRRVARVALQARPRDRPLQATSPCLGSSHHMGGSWYSVSEATGKPQTGCWRREGGGGRGAELELLGVGLAAQGSALAGLPALDAW